MEKMLLKIMHRARIRWLILVVIGILVLIVVPGQDMSAQDVSGNDIFLPLFSSQPRIDIDSEQGANTQGEDGHDHGGIGHIPENGRFTTNDGGEQSWPPQVKYIDEVEWDNRVSAAMIERENEVNAATAVTNQNSELQELLGERYTFISAHPVRKKGIEAIQGQKVTYFSYSNNITIEAVVRNGELATIETFAASDWQPPLRQNEVDAAIEIARQFWQSKGNTRVDALQGFTIQTFQTEGAGGFYDTRMTYVSFHMDETSVPELVAWVDLTTETIYRAAIDKGIENGGMQYVQQ